MLEYIFLDLDGTLTDPSLGITNSIMYALDKLGRDIPPRESLYKFIGPPLVPAFRENFGMSNEEAEKALLLYREYFSEYGLFENSVYSGIPETLKLIKSSGKKLVLATSKPEEYSVRILEHFGLDCYFDLICGASMDEKRVKKADVIRYAIEKLNSLGMCNINRDNAVMIGDRLHDIEGGLECSLMTVGVLWGFGSYEELTSAGADLVFSDVSELGHMLSAM